MNVDFEIDGDLTSSIEPVIQEITEDIGIPSDTRLVCEVLDGHVLEFQANGEITVGGCQCDDDTYSSCKCSAEQYVSYIASLCEVKCHEARYYAIYSIC